MNYHYLMLLLVIIVTLVHLEFLRVDKQRWSNITKPMIIPSIALYYIFSTSTANLFVISALVFSLAGDIFLLCNGRYFIPGMISFAFTHLCYIVIFSESLSWNIFKPWSLLSGGIYAACGIMLYMKVLRNSGPFKIYFVGYMLIIMTMSFISLCRGIYLDGVYPWTSFIGSVFFLISDGALAVGLLVSSKKKNAMFVMATYSAAELLIISGLL